MFFDIKIVKVNLYKVDLNLIIYFKRNYIIYKMCYIFLIYNRNIKYKFKCIKNLSFKMIINLILFIYI